jgi:hypothetical protein
MNQIWIKRSHKDLHQQATLTVNYLTSPTDTNLERMGLTGMEDWLLSDIMPKYSALNTAYSAWVDPTTRTPLVITNLQSAEKAFIPEYRKLYNMLRLAPLVTDADLLSMGLPKHPDGSRTHSPIPMVSPGYRLSHPTTAVIKIDFFDSHGDTGKRGKPDGVHGMEIIWAVLPNPPDGWDSLINSSFDTASPFYLNFTYEQIGLVVYFALRWENTRGVKGPWTSIANAVIS